MHDAPGHDEPLARQQFDATALQVDDERPVHDVEKLVEVVMAVPVVFTLNHAQPHNRVIDAAERLVVPAVRAGGDEGRLRPRPRGEGKRHSSGSRMGTPRAAVNRVIRVLRSCRHDTAAVAWRKTESPLLRTGVEAITPASRMRRGSQRLGVPAMAAGLERASPAYQYRT